MKTTPTTATLAPTAAREDEKFVTVAEIATTMRVCKMTVYRLVHSGELAGAIRVGKSIRVPERVVIDYLKASVLGCG